MALSQESQPKSSDLTPAVEDISNILTDQLSDTSSKIREIIHTGIYKREDNTVYILMTFPTTTNIINVIPESLIENLTITSKFATVFGTDKWFLFEGLTFPPGDYWMKITCPSKTDSKAIIGIKLDILHEPITNFMLSQMIFGFYRSLGLEPSHILKYPYRTVDPPKSFVEKMSSEKSKQVDLQEIINAHTKNLTNFKDMVNSLQQTFSNINEISSHEQIESVKTSLVELRSSINDLQVKSSDTDETEKGSDVKVVSLEEFEKLQEECKCYHNKLVEAEDFIESLQN